MMMLRRDLPTAVLILRGGADFVSSRECGA
jgi:hypothetical protein